MSILQSNAGTVTAQLAEAVSGMAPDHELARQLAQLIGGMMHDRCTRMEDPEGSPWTENAPSTIARKGHDQVGIDSGEMLDRSNFTDLYDLTADNLFELTYGGPADKLGWFEGDNRYGIARVVWGLDPDIRAAALDLIREFYRQKSRDILTRLSGR